MTNLESYRELMSRCTHCGLCQATCPVYLEDLLQTHLARARMDLIRASLLEGSIPVTGRLREVVARCLLCTNCTQTCAAGIPVDEIIVAARHRLRGGVRAAAVRAPLLRGFMRRRGPGAWLGRAGRLAGRLGWLPEDLPFPAVRAFLPRYPDRIRPPGRVRGRVAYFVGCATNTFYPDTAEAVVRVLTLNGIEVLLPRGLSCCGMPALTEGDLATAREMVLRNVTVLAEEEVDACVTDCTSCGMMFKNKALKVLEEGAPGLAVVRKVSERFWEVTDYLDQVGLAAAPKALQASYTYHVPCHRGWKPGMKDAPRRLLDRIPGLQRLEMDEPERCCGAGGSFFLGHRDLAAAIRYRRLEDIRATGARTVVTQCPACRSFLSSPLKDCEVLHPIALLVRACGG